MNPLKRRDFFRYMAALFALLFGGLIHAMLVRNDRLAKRPVRLDVQQLVEGVNFTADFIMIKRADTLTCFRNRCTHAGCRISSVSAEGILRCPCHGSSFHADGSVVSGPALEPLKKLNFRKVNDTQIEILL